ncbi:MAG: hypothetical protein K2O81_06960 [Clostridia bacterium]|nr:hypothetical protein [Clostridia bacterium]
MKNIFKTFICVVLGVLLMLTAVACNNNQGGENPLPGNYSRPSNPNINNEFTATSNTLVAYFSKTNTTKGVAETIQELTDADIFEIERKEPYPNSYTPTTEVAKEEKDNNARPELATYLPDEVIAQYDTIILGFPIWWHTAPMAVLSFLNYYDLSGKTIYTFATSGGSPISESTADIRSNTKATVNEGRLFNRNNETDIRNWLDGLGLISSPEQPEQPETPVNPDDNTPTIPDDEKPSEEPSPAESKVLIAYFSWSGTTTRLAEHVKTMLPNATLYQIERETPYEGSYNDVAYGEAKDEADNNARPPIKNPISVEEMSEYDAIIVMYPIWWHTAPMVVGTFLETYDLSGKDIYPITQSASMDMSQFNQSYSFIRECATLNGRTPTVHEGLGTKATSAIDTYLRQYGLLA